MSNEKIKQNVEYVGAGPVSARKNNNGITLISLIITIIVMLILVGVTVTVALNGGLFRTAKQAANNTEIEKRKEQALAEGEIEIGGIVYGSIEDYRNGNPKLPNNAKILPEEVVKAEGAVTASWDLSKVTAVEITEEDGTTKNTIPLPKGFWISQKNSENMVSKGLVIKDEKNEFVWVPVSNASTYTEDSFGPLEGTTTINGETVKYDSYKMIEYYYGDALGTINSDGTYNSVFTYEADQGNVQRSIRTYGGFYIGRYETTINGGTVGVEQGKPVLTTATILKEGTNSGQGKSGQAFYYRWWGIYKAQKDMYANDEAVGSLMISVKQWSAILKFANYSNINRLLNTYSNYNSETNSVSAPDLSGSLYKNTTNAYDVSKNIYDLAGNVMEFTMVPDRENSRWSKGGRFTNEKTSSSTQGYNANQPSITKNDFGSRVALYIK